MKQLISLISAVLLLSGLLSERIVAAPAANAQFRGSSWRIVSGSVERGGKKIHLAAPRLQGFLVFDASDHFLIVIMRSGPRKSDTAQAGAAGASTPILQRSIACFGTYSFNDAEHTVNVHIEGSTFPKWIGTDQKRQFTLAGDELKWTNASATGGAATAELAWKRVK
jgi:hypothetical protein